MWTHFESIHITMQPTYQSMYFPGQGLLLAAGRAICGNPWMGQLLASALMCAALCWMLQAWLPRNWALLGGTIAVVRLGIFSYWTNTYHAAGSLAALGGALILGGASAIDADGAVTLCPADGWRACGSGSYAAVRGSVLLCMPVALALVALDVEGQEPAEPAARRAWRRRCCVLVIAAVTWLGYYDYRAFGSPLTLPYTVNGPICNSPLLYLAASAAGAGLPPRRDEKLL